MRLCGFFVRVLLISFVGLYLIPAQSRAQGVPWYTIPIPVPNGFVDAATGNVHLEIPLGAVPQRNGDTFFSKMVYDTTSYFPAPITASVWTPRGPGWQNMFGNGHSGQIGSTSSQGPCNSFPDTAGYPNGTVTTWSNWSFTDSHNTTYPLSNQFTRQYQCYNNFGQSLGSSYDTTSLTGGSDWYTLQVTNYSQMTVHHIDGTLVGYTPLDTNGNIGAGSAPKVSSILPTHQGCPGWPQTPPPSSTFTSTVTTSSGPATYTFTCNGENVSEVSGGTTYSGLVNFLTKITLPDGTSYSFTYDTGPTGNHYGALLSVTLPTGGTISFGYAYLSLAGPYPRAASVASAGNTWTIGYTLNSSNQVVSTVLAPSRYDSLTSSYVNDQTVFTSVALQPFLQTAQYYSGASKLLKTVSYSYDINFRPTTVTTALNDTGQSSSTSYQWFTRNYPSQKQETDFSGAIVRTTTTSYNSYAKPTSINVYAGSGTGSPISSTLYSYDEYSTNYCKNGVPMLASFTGAADHDDTDFGVSFTNRGNVTTVQRLISGATYSTTHMCYDTLGNVTQTVDANGNPTSYDYTDNWYDSSCVPSGAVTHGFPKTITDALGHRTQKSYFSCNVLPQSIKDENDIQAGRNGTTFTYDFFNRNLSTNYPDGGSTVTNYQSPTLVSTTRAISSSANLQTATVFDSYHRPIQAQLNSDPDCSTGDKTDTTYDAFGRVQSVSNPYCSTGDPTYGITSYAYDSLGRTTQITNPDQSTQLTSYMGSATQVQDEGNGGQRVTRISQTDGFGRLTSVCEVAPGPFVAAGGSSSSSLIGSAGTPAPCGLLIAGTGFLTTYQYDVLDNLLQVNQSGIAPRTFTYDSMSRLVCASNPENSSASCPANPSGSYIAGTTGYTYDPNGNAATKTAPAPNQTGSATLTSSYTYDALNRLVTKSYSDGTTPGLINSYDLPPSWAGPRQNAIGRKTAWWTTQGCLTMLYDYDSAGRTVGRYEYQPNNCSAGHPISTTYDLMGNMTSQTDGQWHTANYTYNTAGRLVSVTDSQNNPAAGQPPNLLTAVTYNALGQVLSGTTGYGEVESYNYDKRGREQSSTITLNGSTIYSFNVTSFAPNGNILAVTDSSNGNWTYSYDQFNRVTGANQNTGAAVYNYVYDRFGNRWQQNGPHSFTATFTGNNPSSPANNNRIDGYTYDSAGNLINDGAHSYTYDAENRLIQVDGGNTAIYTYDGEGRRASKDDTGSVNSGGNPPDASGTTAFVYDPQGHLVHTEAPNSGTGWQGYVFAGNRHLATYFGNVNFSHSDWLGTERNRDAVDPNHGQFYGQNLTSLPFGDWLDNGQGLGADWSPLNFTGQYHDFESNLDYFGARYYSSTTGRFTSPDPTGGIGDDPQTLNKYSYVVNNPLRYTDPYGLWHCDWGNGDVDDTEGNGGASQQQCRGQGGAWWVSDPGDTDALFMRICMSDCLDSGAPSAASGAGTASSPALGNDEMGPFAAALPMAADIATPGVNFASAGLMIFGIVVAPAAAIGPPACAAFDCGSSGWAMATLPLLPEFASLAPSTRNALLAVAKNQKLRNIIIEAYREGAKIGDGGTADAIRTEIQTGTRVGNKWHDIKAMELRTRLRKLLRDPSLDAADRSLAKRLLTDLQSAMSSGRWPPRL